MFTINSVGQIPPDSIEKLLYEVIIFLSDIGKKITRSHNNQKIKIEADGFKERSISSDK